MITTSTLSAPAAISASRRPGPSRSRIIGLLLGLLALALVGGCSADKLAYNNLPERGYWWIDGYVDLDDAQSVQLRADLARLHDWHRSRELPKVAELLHQVQQQAPADTTPAQVCHLLSEAQALFDAALVQAEPGAVALATRLTAPQLQHLEAHFAKGNEQWRRDWLAITPAERAQKRFKVELDRAQDFYGSLNDGQRLLLQDALQASAFDPGKAWTQRLQRQQDLLQTLRSLAPADDAPAAGPATAAAALRAWVRRAQHPGDPAMRTYAQLVRLDNCQRQARLHNSTSAEQRRRAVARLAAYERAARELAAQR